MNNILIVARGLKILLLLVYTTDDVMAEIGNVPKWEGDVLDLS